MSNWMIYGANGYTGELIARAAAEAGLRPRLAGRNAAAITALARELNLPATICRLDDATELRRALRDVQLVLHCAGPFQETSAPMVAACLETWKREFTISTLPARSGSSLRLPRKTTLHARRGSC